MKHKYFLKVGFILVLLILVLGSGVPTKSIPVVINTPTQIITSTPTPTITVSLTSTFTNTPTSVPTRIPTGTPSICTVQVGEGNYLNLRECDGVGCKIIDWIPDQTVLSLFPGLANDWIHEPYKWVKVTYKDKIGWIYSDFCR